MGIRKATNKDIPELIRIFDKARAFMRRNGNNIQWTNGYPSVELLKSEIDKGDCMICLDGDKPIATFCIIDGNDPTYNYIYNGNWINEQRYAVVHRLASDGSCSGVATKCFDWCFTRFDNIRVDTYKDNTKMLSLLTDYGFKECGIIYVSDNTERVAFQKKL